MNRGNGSRGRQRPGRPFSSVFQASGASDRAAARVIFVILSILLIPSPAVSGPVAMAARAMRLGGEERQRQKTKAKAKDKGKSKRQRQRTGWTGWTGLLRCPVRRHGRSRQRPEEKRGTARRDGGVPGGGHSRFPIPHERSGRFRVIRVIVFPTGPRATDWKHVVSSAALPAFASAA